MSTEKDKLRQFVAAYFECALWAETAHGVPEDTEDGNFDTSFESYGFDADNIDPVAKRKGMRECVLFFRAQRKLLRDTRGNYEQHGYDYWLTRSHHGAGFWDRGYGALGDKLTEAAHADGSRDLYAGDDGRIYGF